MRTYGETQDCRGCYYWSEMLAQASGGGPVEAMCLNEQSPKRLKYTTGRMTCDNWTTGADGIVDWPP